MCVRDRECGGWGSETWRVGRGGWRARDTKSKFCRSGSSRSVGSRSRSSKRSSLSTSRGNGAKERAKERAKEPAKAKPREPVGDIGPARVSCAAQMRTPRVGERRKRRGSGSEAHQLVIRQQCIAVFKIVENTLCSSDGINRGKRGEVMHRGNVKRATVSEEDLKPLSC